ncbi:MAG: M23 family metallopeptidase [Deltaproteobacteria bacterium]|nr:M23 family metallopeptidase [Deltaproteobacteria bacterium]
MHKKRNTTLILAVCTTLLIFGGIGWFLFAIFEGEKPKMQLGPIPAFLTKTVEVPLVVTDEKRGIRTIKVTLKQGTRHLTLLEKQFTFEGLFNAEGVHRFDTVLSIDPSEFNQGRADLEVYAWDYSRSSGGDGNLTIAEHKMTVDTIPPALRLVSRLNYVNEGGTGLIVYQTTSDAIKSGIHVEERFFPGYPSAGSTEEGIHVCYFALPTNLKKDADLFLWAKDKAGNISKASLNRSVHVRNKKFRTRKINISDRFLSEVLPYFSPELKNPTAENVVKFLEINQRVRKENGQVFHDLGTDTGPEKLWEGTWLGLKNAATMSRFGDRRFYYYKGKVIDEQVHMGVDQASLAHSKVGAANNGRIIFADRLGIYGLTVVIDHGQGLASTYSHLSNITVKPGETVAKGDVIALTGQTGLAGGDHLHYGVMVSGFFVNPIEWWDPHWIKDNVTRKLDAVK